MEQSKINREARTFENIAFYSSWENFGDVTHIEAAELFAESHCETGRPQRLIQTRDKPTKDNPEPTIFNHVVNRRMVFDIVPMRGDND